MTNNSINVKPLVCLETANGIYSFVRFVSRILPYFLKIKLVYSYAMIKFFYLSANVFTAA